MMFPARTPAARRLEVLEPPRGPASLGLVELWEYRELLGFLVWRDVKVRYKQTVLGVAWAVLQPLFAALVFTLFFGRVAGIAPVGLPYPLFSFTGLLIWTYFAQATSQSSMSLVGSAHLVTKIYFPRLAVPLATVLASAVDMVVALPVLAVVMVWYGVPVHLSVVIAPVFVVLSMATAAGSGLWLSALNVRYRDVRYVVPFMVQMWLFVSPVIYPASAVAARLQSRGIPVCLLGLNPMFGAVEGFRWAVLGAPGLQVPVLLVSAATACLLLGTGLLHFRHAERTFADVV